MNRRQFLFGASSVAVAAAIPAAPLGPMIHAGMDLASGPDVTVIWRQIAIATQIPASRLRGETSTRMEIHDVIGDERTYMDRIDRAIKEIYEPETCRYPLCDCPVEWLGDGPLPETMCPRGETDAALAR